MKKMWFGILLCCGFVLSFFVLYTFFIRPTQPDALPVVRVRAANGLYAYPFATHTVPYYIRAKNQTPYGLFDASSNTTFLVYPAGTHEEKGKLISNTSAWITAFNHNTHTWEPAVDVTPNHPTSDAHNVPQLLIDADGYLHVFHDAHAHDSGIVHAVSTKPRDISAWRVTPIQHTAGSGYIAAYQSSNQEMYVIYRARLDDTTNCQGDDCAPQALCTTCYEPEYVLKSSDGGLSWTRHRLIDPVKNADGWNTVYTKALVYDEQRNGVHIVFGIHKHHNEQANRHYYVFFDFDDDHVYAADGTDLGDVAEQSEYDAHALLYSYNNDQGVQGDGGTVRMTVALYVNDKQHPVIFHGYCDGKCGYEKNYIRQQRWTGTAWEDQSMEAVFKNVGYIYSLQYKNADDIDLYVRERGRRKKQSHTVIYHFDGTRWKNIGRLFASAPEQESRGIRNMSFIQHAHPELQATFVLPFYENEKDNAGELYRAPKAIGLHYVLGEYNFRHLDASYRWR